MATKWSAVSISGYGDNSPADDGTATEANKVKYSTIKTDLTNPLNTALSSALTGLTEAFNDSTIAKSGTYSTTATDHARTIECTSTFTLSLLAAATAGAGYRVTVKNAGTGIITVARSSTDTIDGLTSVSLEPKSAGTFVVNAAGTGYIFLQQRARTLVQAVEATPYTTYTDVSVQIPADDSIPQSGEGAELCTVSITPTSATSRLVIEAELFGAAAAAGVVTAALFQDATANAIAASCARIAAAEIANLKVRHEMEAGTTSSTTFKLRAGPSSGATNFYVNGSTTARLFGGIAAVRLRVTEYS